MHTPLPIPPARLLAALLWLASAGASAQTIVDTGYIVGSHAPAFGWLDDDTLVLAGKPVEQIGIMPKLEWRLIEYRYSRRSAIDHGSSGPTVCVSGGEIRFYRANPNLYASPPKPSPWIQGALEELVEIPPPPPFPKGPNVEGMSPLIGCQFPHEQPDQEALREEIVRREKEDHDRRIRLIRLKAEHGWLSLADVFDRGREVRPLAIYPPGREDHPIPIDRAPFAAWLEKGYRIEFMRYEAFKGAYLLGSHYVAGSAGQHRDDALWWLHPDGRVEPLLTYPHTEEWEHFAPRGMVPTRTGLLAIGGKSSPRNDRRGLYRRAAGGMPEKIELGWVGTLGALSPDGCRYTYGLDPRGLYGEGPNRYRLRIVDVCADIPK